MKTNKLKPIFKISCEYYLYANDKDEVINFISNEDNIIESHFNIEEGNKIKWGIKEDDVYNNLKWGIK